MEVSWCRSVGGGLALGWGAGWDLSPVLVWEGGGVAVAISGGVVGVYRGRSSSRLALPRPHLRLFPLVAGPPCFLPREEAPFPSYLARE